MRLITGATPDPDGERDSPQAVDVEAIPAVATDVFGAELPSAVRFAELLVTTGLVRGLIGPREPARIWTRHLLNCAVVTDLLGTGQRVVDVGSGAGLPGLAMAIRRPDLRVDLVEPLLRRSDFLQETVDLLGLADRVRVLRGRAEERAVIAAAGSAPWVTARAVAPLDRLVRWCLPLLAGEGHLALMKGSSADAELAQHRAAIKRLGGRDPKVVRCGAELLDPAAAVVLVAATGPVGASRRIGTRKGKR